MTKHSPSDRNFDPIVEHFAHKIYGSIKGEIRQAVIWLDLKNHIPALIINADSRPLRILDIGGGLGQFSIELARMGHRVHYNDLSKLMTQKAQTLAYENGVFELIQWSNEPYQSLLIDANKGVYDVVLCHAVLEWLAEPPALIPALAFLLKPQGLLSLCYYNAASLIYRNLIRGNFNRARQQNNQPFNTNSLTPDFPSSSSDVKNWLITSGFLILSTSGIRVFSDYVPHKTGGNLIKEEVIEMELRYATEEPYKWMGRYIHTIARLQSNSAL